MRPRPEHRYSEYVLSERKRIIESGSFRERVQYDLINRPTYIFGLLTAADVANVFNFKRVTVIELGVANGDGLLNLCELAPRVTPDFRMVSIVAGFW